MAGTADATLANVAVERSDAFIDDTTSPPRIVPGLAYVTDEPTCVQVTPLAL